MKSFPTINVPVRIDSSLKRVFDDAWENCKVIVFSACCGCGKTTAARLLLEGKSVYYVDIFAGFEVKELIGARNFDCVVIDNAQELDDSYTIKCVRSLLDSVPHMRLIVLTRGCVPAWISAYRLRGLACIFEERDLLMSPMTIARLVNDYGVSISSANLNRLAEHTSGYPLAVAIIARLLAQGREYDASLGYAAADEVHDFFYSEVFDRLDAPTKRIVERLTLFDFFTPQLARVITEDDHAGQRMERLRKTSSAFEGDADHPGALRMKGLWSRSLKDWVQLTISDEERAQIYERAGNYYSGKGEVAYALECYEKAHRQDLIRRQLIENARSYLRISNYRSAEPYYLRISRENILSSPLLIYGMSVLSSLQLRPDEGEQWREELVAFAQDERNAPKRRREARMRHAFLKLVLPQYGSAGYIESLQQVCAVLDETGEEAPLCSLVAGAPGFLGSIQDFSALMLEHDGDISAYEDEFVHVFGTQGSFFARFLGIEYAFAQGKLKKFHLHELSRALPAIHRQRLYDMEFAVNSIIARGELYFGNASTAYDVVEAMIDNFANSNVSEDLLHRARTLRCRMALYTKKESVVSDWLATESAQLFAPPVPEHSYLYMTQALAYAVRGEYRKALYSIDNVERSTPGRTRILNDIYCLTLTAICHYQLEGPSWQRILQDAVDTAAPYGYIGMFEQFGDLLRPLVVQGNLKAPGDFGDQLAAFGTGEIGTFPAFGQRSRVLENPLTPAEQRVLELLCEDKSNADICRALKVKLPTVKTHVSHIFAKLGCKRRSEARNIALELGLV